MQMEQRVTPARETREPDGPAHGAHPSPREYVRIFLLLAAITSVEVGLYFIREDLGGWFIPTLFVMALLKFALVVLWYMHLKFDDRRLSRFFMMGLAGATTLYLVVLLSFRVFLG